MGSFNYVCRMGGLLDFMFERLDIESLPKPEVKEYLCYLQEIVPQLATNEDKVKFLGSRVRLNKRLVDLDCQEMSSLQKNIGEMKNKLSRPARVPVLK